MRSFAGRETLCGLVHGHVEIAQADACVVSLLSPRNVVPQEIKEIRLIHRGSLRVLQVAAENRKLVSPGRSEM